MRIRAARAARRHPVLLDMLRDGRLHLSGIVRLLPVLTLENRDALLARATHRSKRQILELVAEISPRPDVPALTRKLPQPRSAVPPSLSIGATLSPDPGYAPTRRGEAEGQADQIPADSAGELCPDTVAAAPAVFSKPTARALVEPLSPGRYQVQFTASAEFHAKLERLRALMGSRVPDGDFAAILDHAVSETLARLEARRFAKTNAPRKSLAETDTAPASRYVPAAVRRAVHERDGNRCGHVDTRCARDGPTGQACVGRGNPGSA